MYAGIYFFNNAYSNVCVWPSVASLALHSRRVNDMGVVYAISSKN